MKKHDMPFYGAVYRGWSKLIHKFGYHYAPRTTPINGGRPSTERGVRVEEYSHWCHWCGLRGNTIDVTVARRKKKRKPLK